jgi:hypothetical protein
MTCVRWQNVSNCLYCTCCVVKVLRLDGGCWPWMAKKLRKVKFIVDQHCSKSEQRYNFYPMPGNNDDQQLLFLGTWSLNKQFWCWMQLILCTEATITLQHTAQNTKAIVSSGNESNSVTVDNGLLHKQPFTNIYFHFLPSLTSFTQSQFIHLCCVHNCPWHARPSGVVALTAIFNLCPPFCDMLQPHYVITIQLQTGIECRGGKHGSALKTESHYIMGPSSQCR